MFLMRGKTVYQVRLGRVVLSTGTSDRVIAADVERMVQSFRAQRRWTWLELLTTKAVKLADAYDAYAAGTVDAFFADALEARTDADLDPVVQQWADEGAEPKSVRQVRRLIPAGERFPLSRFRRRIIAEWLNTLKPEARTKKLTRATRERYKAALSAFGEFLIEREYLDGNPVHGIKLAATTATGKRAARETKEARRLTPEQQQALVEALEEPYRSREALMAGAGVEWQVTAHLAASDVDLERRLVHAKGTKTPSRWRYVEVTEEWAWELFAAWVRAHPDAERLWPDDEKAALEAHHAAAKRLALPFTTLHNHRHAFAVTWIQRGACGGLRKDGRDEQWLKNQLGHKPNSNQLRAVYGVYIGQARLEARNEAMA